MPQRSQPISVVACATVAFCCALATLWMAAEANATGFKEGTVSETFKPVHLSLEEAVVVFKEMTGLEDVVADPKTHTIEVTGPRPMLKRIDAILKTFDTGQPANASPRETRVFQLKAISAPEAITLLRSKLHVTECFQAADRQRVAVRDTATRLEEAATLLAQADVSSN